MFRFIRALIEALINANSEMRCYNHTIKITILISSDLSELCS